MNKESHSNSFQIILCILSIEIFFLSAKKEDKKIWKDNIDQTFESNNNNLLLIVICVNFIPSRIIQENKQENKEDNEEEKDILLQESCENVFRKQQNEVECLQGLTCSWAHENLDLCYNRSDVDFPLISTLSINHDKNLDKFKEEIKILNNTFATIDLKCVP